MLRAASPLTCALLRAFAEAAELTLSERAENHDAIRQARGDRRRGVADGRRDPASARAPLHVGETELLDAERCGEPGRLVAVVGVRGESVDVRDVDRCIRTRRQDGPAGEHELGVGGFAPLIVDALADADDRYTSTQRSSHPVCLAERGRGANAPSCGTCKIPGTLAGGYHAEPVSCPGSDRFARRAWAADPRRPRRRRRQGRAARRQPVAPRAAARLGAAAGAAEPALPRLQPRQAQRRARSRQRRGRDRVPAPRRQRRFPVRERRAGRDGRARPRLRGAARGEPAPGLRRDHAVRAGRPVRAPSRDRSDARGDGRHDGAERRRRSPAGAHHRAADLVSRRGRERGRRAGRAPSPARHGRGAVRRRVSAGGGLLDRPQRDDRACHPGQEHRAQRHRAAAQHADDAARLSVRRRRGRADHHDRHAARAWSRGCSRTAR